MNMYTRESLDAHIEKTLAQRLEGNAQLLAGDLQGALKTYHNVLLSLKGLDSPIQNLFGIGKPEEDSDESSDGEEEDEEGVADGSDRDKGKAPAKKQPSPPEPTRQEKVKSAILNTYLNMAKCSTRHSIYIKQEQWKKALRAAESAKQLHSDHPKAVFREAQAYIGLGETYHGRKMLQNLQKKHPDAAITAALQKLDLDEKARQKKADAQFRGIFAAKSKTFGRKAEGTEGAKITEIKEDEDDKPKATSSGDKKATAAQGGKGQQGAQTGVRAKSEASAAATA
ncbi:hypothetical protein JCM10908_004151 [Rhodotorula pacifica]|uniref:tetratricopeptide repeat protein n=1 Tax=Rhodotorula pacifica TaxID=1495444 RepID=UPI00317643DA